MNEKPQSRLFRRYIQSTGIPADARHVHYALVAIDEQETVMDKISSVRNPLCLHMRKLGGSREYRYKNNEFLCDGIKLLKEAVQSGAEVKAVLTASDISFPLPVETHVYRCNRSVIGSVSPLKVAPGPLFTCVMPARTITDAAEGTHILLDGLQDPGNVGTIIRTADAFAVNGVILTNGCADIYNPKAIRASMGAIFRQNIYFIDLAGLMGLKGKGFRLIGAVPGAGKRDISGVQLHNTIVAIGNEGNGLSKDILSICDEEATIPISQDCESLNAAVAAAIVMWETARQQVVVATGGCNGNS